MGKSSFLFIFSLLIFWLVPGPALAQRSPAYISDIHIQTSETQEIIKLISSRKLQPRAYKLPDPLRLVIDIPDAQLVPGILQKSHESPWIRRIRASQFLITPPTVRVVIDLNGDVPFDIQEDKTSLVITLLMPGTESKEAGIFDQFQMLIGKAHQTITDLEEGRWPQEIFWETTTKTYEVTPIALLQTLEIPKITLLGTPISAKKIRTEPAGGGVLYFSPAEFAELIGATYSFRDVPGTASFQVGNTTQVSLHVGARNILLNGRTLPLPAPIIVVGEGKDSELLVPGFSFAGHLGLASKEGESEEIAIQPSIQEITFEKKEGYEQIILHTSGPFGDMPAYFGGGRGDEVVLLPHMSVSTSSLEKWIGERGIKKISLSESGIRQSNVHLSLAKQKNFIVTALPEENQIIFIFAPALSTLKVERRDDGVSFLAFGKDPFESQVDFLQDDPMRLIVKIPGRIMDQKSVIALSRSLPDTIHLRGGQHHLKPPEIQLVFDLAVPAKYFVKRELKNKRMRLTLLPDPKLSIGQIRAGLFSQALHGKVIAIEAGHGGKDVGSQSTNGTWEKELTLRTALHLAEKLSQVGAHVVLTREEDVTVTPRQIVHIVNAARPDLFLSIHYNAFVDKGIGGTETYYFSRRSIRLAETIHGKLIKAMGRPDRGVRRATFYTVHHARVPSVLLEPLYLTNAEEAKMLQNPDFHKKLAWDIVEALKSYFRREG